MVVNSVPTEVTALWWDRVVISLTLILLTALAWSYLLWLSADMNMGGMDMSGFRMIPSGMGDMIPAQMPWSGWEFVLVFAMWTVMMAGMMTPSTAPMLLMYARMGRQTEAQGRPLAATVWFAIGYFLVWAAFALFATLMQWFLERNHLLDFTMASTNHVVGAIIFVVAGLYQWTRLNDLCITRCQRPFEFLMRQGGYRRDVLGLRSAWASPRRVLRWLLLDADGTVARRRRNELALDRSPFAIRSFGAQHFHGPSDSSPCWHSPRCGRRVVVLNGSALTWRMSAFVGWHKGDVAHVRFDGR